MDKWTNGLMGELFVNGDGLQTVNDGFFLIAYFCEYRYYRYNE